MGVSVPPAGVGPTGRAAGPERRAEPAGGRRFGALRHRSFALLWGGLLLSNTGTWMQGTAQGYLVYELTSSPLALGLLALGAGRPAEALEHLEALWAPGPLPGYRPIALYAVPDLVEAAVRAG